MMLPVSRKALRNALSVKLKHCACGRAVLSH